MSSEVQHRRVAAGDTNYLRAAWQLKERVRREENVLRQDRSFFSDQYRRGYDYLTLDAGGSTALGFAVVRPDGYLSLLGVDPDHRRRGIGTRILDRIRADFDRVTCHTRVENDAAVAFYTSRGFVVADKIPFYYRDGAAAYKLTLADGDGSVVDRLASQFDVDGA